MAAGLAVVSTPYLYAAEVLAEGRGQLVPFGDSDAMADAALRYLQDPGFRLQTRQAAYRYAKPMFWSNVGQQYAELFDRVASERESSGRERSRNRLDRDVLPPPRRLDPREVIFQGGLS
jgi:glycosyltransferase involved in cell wall biosynthesis